MKNNAEKEFYSLIKDFSVSDKKIQALIVMAQEFAHGASLYCPKKNDSANNSFYLENFNMKSSKAL